MSSEHIDFSGVQSFDTVEVGTWEAQVTDLELKDSKSSEFQYLNWKLTLIDGPQAGQNCWLITSLSPKALFRLKESAIACGIPADDLATQVSLPTLTAALLGARCRVKIVHEEYEGEAKAKVDKLLTSSETQPRSLSGPSSAGRAGRRAPRTA
ncbi:MAG TPA: DUF669 domain-containing protein [Bacillota bacterium]|nr:DUF669 domain-containing protein [Dermatophilaceae bacterium]HOI35789.1 DUF669 domain-containing protein [Bacillota bacterium]